MKSAISLITTVLLILTNGVFSYSYGNASAVNESSFEVAKIEFCQVQFILDYEKYYGIFLDSNQDVYSFAIDNVTEDWNLYGNYSEEPIKLNDPMPQEGLIDYLYEHPECYKLIGKTSLEDYENYKRDLKQINPSTEMEYRLICEPDVIGLGHTERFAVRYDDNGDRKIVFLCGGIDTKYDLYLENLDDYAIALNSKMIQYEEINESATTSSTTATTVTTIENTPNSDTTTISTDNTESTITTTETTTTTATNDGSIETITTIAAPANIASDEELCYWAAKDYEEKTGVTPASAEIEYTADDIAIITLTDADGSVLDVYNIDPFTGIGTEADGGDVNLPQTGYSNFYKVIVWFAILMTISGVAIVAYSRKESE